MKYNCANEFDLEEIYKKLTSDSKSEMVNASNFFVRDDELERLQKRMNKLMKIISAPHSHQTR